MLVLLYTYINQIIHKFHIFILKQSILPPYCYSTHTESGSVSHNPYQPVRQRDGGDNESLVTPTGKMYFIIVTTLKDNTYTYDFISSYNSDPTTNTRLVNLQ